MSAGITAALVSAMVLGLWFNVTRPMAIIAASVLVFIYPALLVPILIGSCIAVYVFLTR